MKHKSMIYESDTVKHPGMMSGFKLFLNSDDYSMKDIFHTFYSSYNLTYTQKLIEDFAEVDLNTIEKVDLPLYFLHGKQDFHVNGKSVEEFYEKVEAPFGKKLVWFKDSAHMFHPNDTEKIEEFIIELVQKQVEVNHS